MYEIDFRRDINLLDISWTGLFTPQAVRAYAESLTDQFRWSGFRPGYRLRIDMSRSAIQTQDALAAFRQQFTGFPVASKIAIVTPSALARLQVRREMQQSYLRLYDSADPALDWFAEKAPII